MRVFSYTIQVNDKSMQDKKEGKLLILKCNQLDIILG